MRCLRGLIQGFNYVWGCRQVVPQQWRPNGLRWSSPSRLREASGRFSSSEFSLAPFVTLATNGELFFWRVVERSHKSGLPTTLQRELTGATSYDAIVVLHGPVSPTPPSSRRWPGRSRPANLPEQNGLPSPSSRSALATRGRD